MLTVSMQLQTWQKDDNYRTSKFQQIPKIKKNSESNTLEHNVYMFLSVCICVRIYIFECMHAFMYLCM